MRPEKTTDKLFSPKVIEMTSDYCFLTVFRHQCFYGNIFIEKLIIDQTTSLIENCCAERNIHHDVTKV